MLETSQKEMNSAISTFRDRYGEKKPLDMFILEEIIQEHRTDAKKAKTKGRKNK